MKAPQLALQVVTDSKGIPGLSKFEHWAAVALDNIEEPRRQLTIRITGDDEIRTLNRQYRNRDQVTNVLSFEFDALQGIEVDLLGDIVISAPQVLREASTQDISLEAHWAHLVVHGILHLCGYDHIKNKDAEIMEGVEIEILRDLGFPDPYGGA